MSLKIADSNFLRSDDALAYLSASRSNRVALTETVLTEMYKKRPEVTVPRSLQHLARFPKQVIVLKQFPDLYHFPIKSARCARRLFDNGQTKAFPDFIADILDSGDDQLKASALQAGHANALQRMAEIERETVKLPNTFKRITDRFTKDERDQLRKRVPYADQTQRKLLDLVFDISAIMFDGVGLSSQQWPQLRVQAYDYLIFRYALCVVLLYTRWVNHGQQMEVKLPKMVNDINDAHLASVATYFGGVLSSDQKLLDIHREARYLLRLARGYIG